MDEENLRRLKTISATVSEETKIKVDQVIRQFLLDSKLADYTLPNVLTSQERAYVHAKAVCHGLKSQSSGAGERRCVTISKASGGNRTIVKTLELSNPTASAIKDLDKYMPIRTGDFDRRIAALENAGQENRTSKIGPDRKGYTNRLCISPKPTVPPTRRTNNFEAARMRLPIWNCQQTLLDAIAKYKVTFIKGDTGCGKTTQVPQFILDDACARKQPVRLLCTVPRRIAAISISDRVAEERGEHVGYTVGYQIRLESKYSSTHTLLTYCTSGVLLRSLTAVDYSILKNTTHIIIDEIHERDRQTDFLLACLRDLHSQFPNLRVILMGADMDTQLMQFYFGGPESCPLMHVEGRLYPVEVLFLEDVLNLLQYQKYQRQNSSKKSKSKEGIYQGLVNSFRNTGSPKLAVTSSNSSNSHNTSSKEVANLSNGYEKLETDVDSKIQRFWTACDESSLQEFLDLAKDNRISVDYQHSMSQCTMLMACAVRGSIEGVRTLLSLGADPSVRMHLPSYGRFYTAKDWAADHGQLKVVQLLTEDEYHRVLGPATHSRTLDPTSKERLDNYQNAVDDDRVDLQLILTLLHWIHVETDINGAVLIFLPGYEEIVTLRQMIFMDPTTRNLSDSIVVFLLHSNIQTGDQRAVFEKTRRGTRKVVLSTNIAETSLTIEDVVYVIDSGKAKEKTFDTMSGVTQLRSNWISKASANQRQGRAGRCRAGKCFRLYSFSRYESMTAFPIPEIVRSSLQELCLYTRAFIRSELNILDFFSRLPEPPAPIAIKKSVDMLISMGALDEKEQLTQLGIYLLDLPIEPYLGKALIYAIVLKCLDPVLTIITFISHRDPFQLPGNPDDKSNALNIKLVFSADAMSDHMAALKAFHDWEKAKLFRPGVQYQFCREHYLSPACFEMVYGIRQQLLGQLRASGFIQTSGACDLKDLNINSNNWPLVKGVLTATLYPNVCGINKQKKCLFNEFENKISFHASSIVGLKRTGGVVGIPTDWVLYDEMSQNGAIKTTRNCTVVSTFTLAVFAGNFNVVPEICDGGLSEGEGTVQNDLPVEKALRFNLNSWITFRAPKKVMDAVGGLRTRLRDLVHRRLKFPSHIPSQADDTALKVIALSLMYEDKADGYPDVKGVEQWPKFASGNMMAAPRAGYERSQVVNEEATAPVSAFRKSISQSNR